MVTRNISIKTMFVDMMVFGYFFSVRLIDTYHLFSHHPYNVLLRVDLSVLLTVVVVTVYFFVYPSLSQWCNFVLSNPHSPTATTPLVSIRTSKSTSQLFRCCLDSRLTNLGWIPNVSFKRLSFLILCRASLVGQLWWKQ